MQRSPSWFSWAPPVGVWVVLVVLQVTCLTLAGSKAHALSIFTVDAGTSANPIGEYTSVALDPTTYLPRISYYDANSSNLNLKYASYNGTTWALQTLDSTGNVGEYTSLAFNGSNPWIAYYDVTNTNLKYASSTNGGSTFGTVGNVMANTANDAGTYASLQIAPGTTPTPMIAYRDTGIGLRFTKYTSGAWSTPVSVDATSSRGLYASLAVDPTNSQHLGIAYSSTTATTSTMRYAYSINGGTSWNVAATNWTNAQYCSLEFDSSGHAHISYYSSLAANQDLRYLSSTSDTAWGTAVLVDGSSTIIGQYDSLALDASNNPRISYYDSTNGNLQYASYNGTSWTTAALDSTGNVGQFTSLALDPSGNAHISYFDVTNGALKYAETPEPSSAAILMAGLGLAVVGWRRRRAG